MKTYSVPVLREAFFSLIDRNKYVKFSIYIKPFEASFGKKMGKIVGGRALKCKGKIEQLFGGPLGLTVSFNHLWVSRIYCIRSSAGVPLRNIRWIDCPFESVAFENLCIMYMKKLEAPKEVS